MSHPPCMACGAESYWTVWGCELCPRCYGSWCEWPENTASAIGHDLPHEEFCRRATEATRRWFKQYRPKVRRTA